MRSFLDKLGEIVEDPFDSSLMALGPMVGAIIGFLIGLYSGFVGAGIGGAIAYSVGGLLVGGITGFFFSLILGFMLQAIPWIILILIIGGVIWIVRALWNVGKP